MATPENSPVLKNNNFTERARKVVDFASSKAAEWGDSEIQPPHFILGIVAEGNGLAAAVLIKLGVDFADVRLRAAALLSSQRSEILGSGKPELSFRSRRALFLGAVEADQRKINYTGTHHLLIGVIAEAQESNDQPVLDIIRNSASDQTKLTPDILTAVRNELMVILTPQQESIPIRIPRTLAVVYEILNNPDAPQDKKDGLIEITGRFIKELQQYLQDKL